MVIVRPARRDTTVPMPELLRRRCYVWKDTFVPQAPRTLSTMQLCCVRWVIIVLRDLTPLLFAAMVDIKTRQASRNVHLVQEATIALQLPIVCLCLRSVRRATTVPWVRKIRPSILVQWAHTAISLELILLISACLVQQAITALLRDSLRRPANAKQDISVVAALQLRPLTTAISIM